MTALIHFSIAFHLCRVALLMHITLCALAFSLYFTLYIVSLSHFLHLQYRIYLFMLIQFSVMEWLNSTFNLRGLSISLTKRCNVFAVWQVDTAFMVYRVWGGLDTILEKTNYKNYNGFAKTHLRVPCTVIVYTILGKPAILLSFLREQASALLRFVILVQRVRSNFT